MSQKLVCNCNGTMPLDAKALGVTLHTSLCRQEVGSFIKALDSSDSLVVACTQEAALFRECVTACASIGAISFDRKERERNSEFDLILDLRADPKMRMSQTPQGYFAPGADPLSQALVINQLTEIVGEFEKPKYFVYNDKICAHGRNGKVGCSACIDVCSTGAISSFFKNGQGTVEVNPNLCMGCGACATTCLRGNAL